MLAVLAKKTKESLISVLPIVAIVVLLNLTPLVDFSAHEIITFVISAVVLIIGIGFFNLGADMAMTPIGEHVGSGLSKLKSLTLLLSVALAMGILITIAEPDLAVLANQVSSIMNGTVLIVTIGVGVGIFLLLAVLKIVFNKSLSQMLLFFYMTLFALAAILIELGKGSLIPLAFDSGGVTTGPITVPFIMALGVGIASTIGGKNSRDNSFGLIALCSVGPMLAVLMLSLFSGEGAPEVSSDYLLDTEIGYILHTIFDTAKEVVLALGLIVIFFVILQIFVLKLPKTRIVQISIGILYTFLGLVLFLSAVKVGFMPIGYKLGVEMSNNPPLLAIFSFVIGMVVVLAEPAVHVLKGQVAEVTEGTVSAGSMTIALSIGVGLSICLSAIRIIFDFSILWYLVPGYLIALGLSFFVPPLYTGIAFDSGGVASGPLTSSFILPFAVGACVALQGEASILADAFGVVAMVAMAPLITIQLLGFRAVMAKRISDKIATNRILSADDEQIINFT